MPLPDPPEAATPDSAPESAPVLYRTRHTTRYEYGDGVSVSQHIVHLLPRDLPHQHCASARLTIKPEPAVRSDWTDYFGNPVTYIAVQEPHRVLEITSEIELEVSPPLSLDLSDTPAWETLCGELLTPTDDAAVEASRFAFDSVLVGASADLAEYSAPSFPLGRPVAIAALDLMRRIYADFTFDATATTISTPLAEVLAYRRGVCQDFAHLGIGCLRSVGLAGRYVSGYLRTHPPPGRPRLVGADVSHAWFSVWCGSEAGWLDLDPTNDQPANADYITLAWGRDYDDVSPVRGVLLGGYGHTLDVQVDVEPLGNARK